MENLQALLSGSLQRIESVSSKDELESIRLDLLGKKGELTKILKSLGTIEPLQRKRTGSEVNRIKQEINSAIEKRMVEILDGAPAVNIPLDVTLPGTNPGLGGLHPITQMKYDLNDAFMSLNFNLFEGPEITDEWFDFDNLNFPPDHPARESMDTYWLSGFENNRSMNRLCLRPHLTGASVYYMKNNRPPFRIIYPGRVYRNETTDARHERAFYQYEALIVDKEIPFTTGRIMIDTILNTVFGHPVKTRMRAGYFPFVEPGFEIDMQCLVCNGKGCKVCKHVGWLEIMPGGAPHPKVFQAGGIDPQEWMGFYINVGLDRLVMMRYQIDDVRLFHSGDLRFLSQFKYML